MGLFNGSVKSVIKSAKPVLDNMPEQVFIVDRDKKLHYINDNALSFLGFSREEVIGKMTCKDLCKTTLCDSENCSIERAVSQGKAVGKQVVAQKKNGVRVPARISVSAFLNGKGDAIGGIAMMTEARHLDEGFLDNMAEAAFRTDTNFIVQNINDSALSALGYTREEVVGKMSCADLCKTPLCRTLNCTIKNCMEKKTTVIGTTVAETRNGMKVPLRASCGVLVDDRGEVTGGFEILTNVTQMDEGFLNNMPDPAFRTDTNLVVQNINEAALSALGYTREEVVGKMNCGDLCRTTVCGTADCTIKNCIKTGGNLVAETVATTRDGRKIPVRASCGVLFDVNGNPSGGFEIISDNTDLMNMISGLQSVSQGDLTVNIDDSIKSRDDAVGKMAEAVDYMIKSLSEVINGMIISANNLSQAVQEISAGNQNLSQRTSEQASALEEIASAIEETSATIKQNAANAEDANKSSVEANNLAVNGGEVVGRSVEAMNEISDASKKINEIISVINDISFQTNLLSLNAAVEAARAGEQGRGFAVVAGEVRNLAQRSSSAAKEIENLIKDSLEKIERGTKYSNESGESLNVIIESIKSASGLVSEIAAASEEQRRGIEQISTAITQMDEATQQNASLVEETAAASEEMAAQASELISMTKKFRVESLEIESEKKEAGKNELKQKGNVKNCNNGKSKAFVSSDQDFTRAVVDDGFNEGSDVSQLDFGKKDDFEVF